MSGQYFTVIGSDRTHNPSLKQFPMVDINDDVKDAITR